jgi:small-conductance mechanosensitive channel
MSLFRKDWTPADADEWTIHDLLASVLSVASYFLVAVGVAGALLLKVWGFVALAAGLVSIVLMFLIIDPKLKAMSQSFEKKQQQFLEHIDKTTRWEQ